MSFNEGMSKKTPLRSPHLTLPNDHTLFFISNIMFRRFPCWMIWIKSWITTSWDVENGKLFSRIHSNSVDKNRFLLIRNIYVYYRIISSFLRIQKFTIIELKPVFYPEPSASLGYKTGFTLIIVHFISAESCL